MKFLYGDEPKSSSSAAITTALLQQNSNTSLFPYSALDDKTGSLLLHLPPNRKVDFTFASSLFSFLFSTL